MSGFELDSRLADDTFVVADLALCRLLAMRTTDHPWLILVPRRAGLVEILDLAIDERALLRAEIDAVAEALRAETGAHKLNIAALGNVVSQLHVHVIARFRDDPAWPAPVWGRPAVRPIPRADLDALARRLTARLGLA